MPPVRPMRGSALRRPITSGAALHLALDDGRGATHPGRDPEPVRMIVAAIALIHVTAFDGSAGPAGQVRMHTPCENRLSRKSQSIRSPSSISGCFRSMI
jgi:hypothetical protein